MLEKTHALLTERVSFLESLIKARPDCKEAVIFKEDCEKGIKLIVKLQENRITVFETKEDVVGFLKTNIGNYVQQMINLANEQANGLNDTSCLTTTYESIQGTIRMLNECGMEILFLR
jgi:Cu2+-containing amine oxidase